MSFSDFCSAIDDGQKIVTREAFVLSFTNSADEVFNIDPDIIFQFMNSFVDNYDAVVERWLAVPTKKSSLDIYEEKSYRAIYKYFSSSELKVISSIGSSQTKALTQLLAKVISYLTDQNYTHPNESTFFEKQHFTQALVNWNKLFSSSDIANTIDDIEIVRERFRLWLLKEGQSERSARSHSTTSINTSDKRLKELEYGKKSLFLCTSEEVLVALSVLESDAEWSAKDSRGGNMYSVGVKKLSSFLKGDEVQSVESREEVYMFKPFVLLAGISGTGKTRFVREQVKANSDLSVSYQLTAVRPDWDEPGDLLGYQSRLSGKTEYVVTDILCFICKAWCAIADSGTVIESRTFDGRGSAFAVLGEVAQLDDVLPFWLCLDEMNLAPVEQYFADYLSILETREWQREESRFTYLCDPLLPASTITDLATDEQDRFRSAVGLNDPAYESLWRCFCEQGIGIPFNLIVAGTVNMDETTHGFSRKVLDRALTIDFDEFFPNDLSRFFNQDKKPVTFTYPVLSEASIDRLPDIDVDGAKSIAFLERINEVLDDTPFKVAYRAVNELLLMVICMRPGTDLELNAIWDDFLMLKVLPRIEGDIDKLGSRPSGGTVLKELLEVLERDFAQFWNIEAGAEGARPDLFLISSTVDSVTASCRSKSKIQWMQHRLDSTGFTSFWP